MASSDAESAGATAWTALPNGRVAEIIAGRRDAPGGRGSGYLIAPGLVLTCSHVVEDASELRVRFNAGGPQQREFEAATAWRHEGIDVAVLTLDDSCRQEVRPESFARIGDRTERLDCDAKGFPLFKLRRDEAGGGRYRNVDHMQARCAPHANWRDRTLELRVSEPPDPYADPREPGERGGRYEPWAGMSGAVVFSAGRVVGVVTRHHAAEGGRLTASRVDSWHELVPRDRLRRLETLLGCGSLDPAALPAVVTGDDAEGAPQLPEGVHTHSQELARGTNQRKYLTSEQVPFVSPGTDHRADPDNLLDDLAALSAAGSRPGDLGVVLVGAAGSGKTRTCFEVAEKAAEDGWTVLHLGRDAAVPAEELADAVGAFHSAGRDVLLVLDYLDRYTPLDAGFTDMVEERRTRRARLACIASLRPGAVQYAEDREQLRLFERIEVCQEESHQEAVTRGIVENAAPAAVKALGAAEVAAVCGPRPVLALLIARAIEYRFLDGERDVLRLAGLRNDRDLSYWLRQRTREDFSDGRTRLLASAVAATACPQGRDAVEDAVAAFLEHHDDRGFEDGEVGVVGHLKDLSWLVGPDRELDVMHDFVADELLQQALLPNKTRLEGNTAARMFSALLVSVRTFGLAADHIRRWSTDLDPGKREDVRRVCDNWLTRKGATGLAERLAAEADPSESARTLLALLAGAPWQSGAVEAWDTLVEPWLARAADEAPHLTHSFLAAAVRDTSDAVPERLSATALAWVEANPGMRYEARAVLEALLRATGLCEAHRSAAARLAAGWLGEHGTVRGSRPLALTESLLGRDDLPADIAQQAVTKGLSVADSHLAVPASAHVLDALLRPSRLVPLEPGPYEAALTLAFSWLRRHPDSDAASFVLAPLLQQTGLEEGRLRRVFDRSLNWLAGRRTSPLATFVLRHLLKHPELDRQRAEDAARIAMDWLGTRGDGPDATYVLAPLLLRPDHGQDPEHIAGLALRWLEDHHPWQEAHFVLRGVLEQPRLPAGAPERIAQYALSWLRTGAHGTADSAKSALAPLLMRRGLPHGDDFCSAAVRWLGAESNLGSEEASFVLKPLLRHPALGPHTKDAGELALRWLETHPRSENVSYVLEPLLLLRDFEGVPGAPEADGPVGIAFEWLAEHGTSRTARFVLAPLLHPARAGVRAVPQALAWLGPAGGGTLREASHVLEPLLKCPGLDEASTAEAAERALEWLEIHHSSSNAEHVAAPLLHVPLPEGTLRARVVGRVLEWADDGHFALSHDMLRALCRQGPLPVEQGSRIAEHVAEQSRQAPGVSNGAVERLGVALRRQDIGERQLAPLVDLADEWLGIERHMHSRGSTLLKPLLSRTDLDAAQARRVTDRALEWLGKRGDTTFAGVILGLLLRRRETPAPANDRAPGETSASEPVQAAFAWLAAHPSHAYAGAVLSALLERPGLLTRAQQEECARLAADWLRTTDHPDAAPARDLAALLEGLPEDARSTVPGERGT
ncbi:hypothetical protein HCC61_00335 [Streptomyces sp. HNM0575]|uniref:trypsin-like peptidase domain-containing protein n=1 Tax=Streptomyces sp. HNM0575 TaxID=2716338 RepID=UPI00145E1071|nr:trypsin-like peptidase domain-containing protein [Streptomyces sp. HNM0575]NLU71166.1 hypothetical protein [Streptomyces sp. HNM0575]